MIENARRRARFALAARTIVGRSTASQIRLDSRHVSAEHAAITWTPAGWHVRDLASTNGTWLGGARLGAGRRVPLSMDVDISFGDPMEVWRLIDEAPPAPCAWNLGSNEIVHGAGELLVIPGPAGEVRVTTGERGGWRVDRAGTPAAVADGDVLELAGARWQLLLPSPQRGTRSTQQRQEQIDKIADSHIEFTVSRNEEHVEVTMFRATSRATSQATSQATGPAAGQATVQAAGQATGPKVSLPSGRSCHYLLATLAQMQLDAAPAEDGWVSVHALAHALKYTVERVNIEIYRARQLLAKAKVPDAHKIVLRRTGILRIGSACVSVFRVGPPKSPAL